MPTAGSMSTGGSHARTPLARKLEKNYSSMYAGRGALAGVGSNSMARPFESSGGIMPLPGDHSLADEGIGIMAGGSMELNS